MVLSIALLFAAAGTPDPFGVPLVAGDWIAGCDNHGDCRLFTLPVSKDRSAEDEETIAEIAIERAYAVNQPLRVEILLSSLPAGGAESLTLRFDGKAAPFRLRWNKNVGTLATQDELRFVRRLRTARLVEIVEGKKVIGRASVAGLPPLLAYVDKQQYRIGTVGAFNVPGTKPVDYFSVPPLIPQPAIKIPPPSSQSPVKLTPAKLAEILKTDVCLKYQEPGDTVPPEAEYVRLDKDNTLALVGSYCGGYNPTLRLYVIDNDGNARLAQFGPNPLLSPDDPENYLPGAWWNDKDHQLSAFGRARGFGDCGQQASFVWNGEKFVTVEFSSMPECRGSFNYVVTYKREVAR